MSQTLTVLLRGAAPAEVERAPPVQLKALTSVRFFAALHVALFHMVPGDPARGFVALVISVGYTGVSFFFVLSGFILTYSHAREYESGRVDAGRFYFARFARIYPVYLLSMVVAGYVYWAQFGERRHLLVYGVDLVMMQSWSTRMVGFFNGPGWTLSCEAAFYLLFPWVVMRLRPASVGRGVGWLAAFWGLSLAGPVWCCWRTFGAHWGIWAGYWTNDLALRMERVPVFQVPEFLAGMAVGWLLVRFGVRRKFGAWLVVAGLVYTVGVYLLSLRLPLIVIHNGLLIPGYALMILGLSGENVISRGFSAGWLVLLGEASYVFYLAHHMFHHWVMERFGVRETVGAGVVQILVLIPVAVGIHLAVERPARRWLLERRRERGSAKCDHSMMTMREVSHENDGGGQVQGAVSGGDG